MKTHKNNWEERFDDSFPRPLKKEFIDDLEKTYKDTEFVLEPVKNVKGFIRQELASQKEENDREWREKIWRIIPDDSNDTWHNVRKEIIKKLSNLLK